MIGYAINPEDFAYLVKVASRLHRKQIAVSLGLARISHPYISE